VATWASLAARVSRAAMSSAFAESASTGARPEPDALRVETGAHLGERPANLLHRQALLGQFRVAGGQDLAQLPDVEERRLLPRHPHLGQRQDAGGDTGRPCRSSRKWAYASSSGWSGAPRQRPE
jgi:hypothetical protein